MKTPRHTLTRITAVVALLVTIATAASSKDKSEDAFPSIKISNFGQLDEHFYRGARPKERDFQSLKDLGIQTIIDLTDNTPKERGYVESLGMTYVNIAIPDKTDPSDAQIAEFLRIANDPAT